MLNILGRKIELGKCGDAVTLKAWVNGHVVYNVFCSIESAECWVEDNQNTLDTYENDVITQDTNIGSLVYEIDEYNTMTDAELALFQVA